MYYWFLLSRHKIANFPSIASSRLDVFLCDRLSIREKLIKVGNPLAIGPITYRSVNIFLPQLDCELDCSYFFRLETSLFFYMP